MVSDMDQFDRTSEEKPLPLSRPRLVRERLQGKVFIIPTGITAIGIFCGFLAILSALKGNYEYAVKCIGLAFVLDGLDGRVARRLHATSAFGREFDSLSDLVAFGVAPAVLVYSWAFARVYDEFGIVVSFALVVCGATRLARFNISTDSGKHFVGLPIPGAAAAIASFVYLYPVALNHVLFITIFAGYCLLISFLMVSTLPFFSLKHVKLSGGKTHLYLLGVSIVIALVWYHSRIALAVIFNGYALSGLVNYALRKLQPQYFERVKKAVS